jgi:hypothetical protein
MASQPSSAARLANSSEAMKAQQSGVSALLNQRCVLALDTESMFRVEMLKILLQQYLQKRL